MTIDIYFSYCIAVFILSAIPGPTVIVIHYALLYGKWSGRYTIPAVMIGDVIALFLVYVGIEAILNLPDGYFDFFKVIGGIYLIFLGVKDLRWKGNDDQLEIPSKQRARNVFTHVVLVTAFNPKSIVFLLAFIPQFINSEEKVISQFLLLGITFICFGVVASIVYDIFANKINSLLQKNSFQKKIHNLTGIILCGLGIGTIFW
ncbi:MAG: LysE family translocator [Rickettsiaceae bacterium]|nr:LysE family translocator [Rickettsiaceae bacterium]